MKKIKITMLVSYIVALILELLPYGAVLNFANPEGEPWRNTYSYFDLTPFGYANFGPFLTAILTCALLLITVILLFKNAKGLMKIARILGVISVVTSLMPFMFGGDYITVIGVAITVVLALGVCVAFIKRQSIETTSEDANNKN